jgi:hypothetical protein
MVLPVFRNIRRSALKTQRNETTTGRGDIRSSIDLNHSELMGIRDLEKQ